jgi:hypothetical protein
VLITSSQTTPQRLSSRQKDESPEASGRKAVARDLWLHDREEEELLEKGVRMQPDGSCASLVAPVYQQVSVGGGGGHIQPLFDCGDVSIHSCADVRGCWLQAVDGRACCAKDGGIRARGVDRLPPLPFPLAWGIV